MPAAALLLPSPLLQPHGQRSPLRRGGRFPQAGCKDSRRVVRTSRGSVAMASVGEEARQETKNPSGERMVAALRTAGEGAPVAVLCHGFRSSKESTLNLAISDALAGAGISTLRIDFSGNGESEGPFEYANYRKEVEDLQAWVQHLRGLGLSTSAAVGHSKGGNTVLMHAAKYPGEFPRVVSLAGRYDMERGVRERFGEEGMAALEREGSLFQPDAAGGYTVTKESLAERLATDMGAESRAIQDEVLVVHGDNDATVQLADAHSFGREIAGAQVEVVEGGDHSFRSDDARARVVALVTSFLT